MIRKIAVLGAGTMGLGIAGLFADNGYSVTVYDPNEAACRQGEAKLQGRGKGGTAVLWTGELRAAAAAADLIVEAAPEQLELKRALYRELAAALPAHAIVASNTSTFRLQALSEGLAYADRMIIMHFFNPADLVPLVEIVGAPSADPSMLREIAALLERCGKTPVVLKRDVPGFIANRLQAALMREACHLVESGTADIEQVDTAVREGLGLRWAFKGPFEIADAGGLDIWAKVTGHLFPELGGAVEAPALLTDKANEGRLGCKTGQGFYAYDDPAAAAGRTIGQLRRLIDLKRDEADRERRD